jgi:protein-ribulosamine 3-kinase
MRELTHYNETVKLCSCSIKFLLREPIVQVKLISISCLAVAAMSEDPVREWILSEGKATQITKISPVGSGCINLANHYDTDAGSFFVKTNR